MLRVSTTAVLVSIALFLVAGALEIGGGWLVWRAMRGSLPLWCAGIGAVLLAAYGFVPPLQPTHFGRVYAAYGGVFIVGSLAWGWIADGDRPDSLDLIGASLCLAGVAVMMYWPRAG